MPQTSDAHRAYREMIVTNWAHVLTSPLKRALQTCELAGLDLTPEIEPDLAEWDYGDYEGQRSVDIRNSRPDWDVYRDTRNRR